MYIITSESINEIIPAFIAFQSELEPALKDCTNPHYRSSYADLNSVLAVIREPLARNNLALIQVPFNAPDGRLGLCMRIYHKSGQYIEGSLTVKLTKEDAQGAGSAITYLRRYLGKSMLGVSESDDDGNAASSDSKPDVDLESNSSDKVFLNIGFNDKDDAKKMGARWDQDAKKWWVYSNNQAAIKRWGQNKSEQQIAPQVVVVFDPLHESSSKVLESVKTRFPDREFSPQYLHRLSNEVLKGRQVKVGFLEQGIKELDEKMEREFFSQASPEEPQEIPF